MTSHRRKARKRRSLTQKEKKSIALALRESWQLSGSNDATATRLLAEEIEQAHVILEVPTNPIRRP